MLRRFAKNLWSNSGRRIKNVPSSWSVRACNRSWLSLVSLKSASLSYNTSWEWRLYGTEAGFGSHRFLNQGLADNVEASDTLPDIDANEIIINQSTYLKPKPALDSSSLKFGTVYTDHMLLVMWKKGVGWSRPVIDPLGPLQIHPCAQVLHYGLECFEGMKAFKGKDGRLRLFRPDMNMDRLLRSATRLAFPSFDKEALLDCIKMLLRVERDWVPDKEGFSLYIRPTIIATYPHLGVGPPVEATFFCVLSLVGPYFDSAFKPIRLFVDKRNVRAFPGGVGSYKVGGNYAATIMPSLKAAEKDCSQVLYVLEGPDGGIVGESGAMNVFFLFRKCGQLELVTPSLDGTILPGVTRDTVLALTRSFEDIQVSERRLTWNEVERAGADGSLIEVFGTGTACVIQPVVGLLKEDGSEIMVPFDQEAASFWMRGSSGNPPEIDASPFSLCGRLTREIRDIQYGHRKNNWSVVFQD